MQTEFYQTYMKSPQWQQKKAERIDIDKGCVMCKRPLDVFGRLMFIMLHMSVWEMKMYLQIYVRFVVHVMSNCIIIIIV